MKRLGTNVATWRCCHLAFGCASARGNVPPDPAKLHIRAMPHMISAFIVLLLKVIGALLACQLAVLFVVAQWRKYRAAHDVQPEIKSRRAKLLARIV